MTQAKQALMAEFKAALERVRSGEVESEEVDLPTGRVRLSLDENAPSGIRVETVEGEAEKAKGKMRKAIKKPHRF